jgi:hypothetical protein
VIIEDADLDHRMSDPLSTLELDEMQSFTNDDTDRAAAALNAALDRVPETQFLVREKTLLALLSKLEQRFLNQKPTDRAPITGDQIETVSFVIGTNRYAMRQHGVKPLDTARLRNIDKRYGDDGSIDARTAIMSLLWTIDHPTLKLTPAEKLVACAELAVMLDNADRIQLEREAKAAVKH